MNRFEKLWEQSKPERVSPYMERKIKVVLEETWNQAFHELADEIIKDEDRPDAFDLGAEAYLVDKIKKLRTDLNG